MKRYPGVFPFNTEQEGIFKGREADIDNLYTQVLLSNTVTLHAASGTGKSSLINAGLLPEFKRLNPNFIPIVIVFEGFKNEKHKTLISNSEDNRVLVRKLTEKIREIVTKEPEIPFLLKQKNDPWYWSKVLQKQGKSLFFIFDQFENIESYNFNQINAFKERLSMLFSSNIPAEYYNYFLKKSPALSGTAGFLESTEKRKEYNLHSAFIKEPLDTKALFAIREDKLGVLSILADHFPDILKSEYRLLPLDRENAEKAIREPAGKKGSFASPEFMYDDETIDYLLSNLSHKDTGRIDPIAIQIICSHVEKKVILHEKKSSHRPDPESNGIKISKTFLPPIEDCVTYFYKECWEQIGKSYKKYPDEFREIRQTIISELVVNENNVQVYEGNFSNTNSEVIKALIKTGLIREIISAGLTYFQLSHDRFVKPALDDLNEIKAHQEAERQANDERIKIKQRNKQIKQKLQISIGIGLLLLIGFIFFFYQNSEIRTKSNLIKEKSDEIKIKSMQINIALDRQKTLLASLSRSKDSLIFAKRKSDTLLHISNNQIRRLNEQEQILRIQALQNKNMIERLTRSENNLAAESKRRSIILENLLTSKDFQSNYKIGSVDSSQLTRFELIDFARLFKKGGDSLKLFGEYAAAEAVYNLANSFHSNLVTEDELVNIRYYQIFKEVLMNGYNRGIYDLALADSILQFSRLDTTIASLKAKMQNNLICISNSINDLNYGSTEQPDRKHDSVRINCNIEFFPVDAIDLLKNFKKINLENNSIRLLPENFGNLSKLQYLNLYYNNLETIPSSFGSLTGLKKLSFADNIELRIPVGVMNKLTGLAYLNVSNCTKLNFDEILKDLNNLKVLSLSYNSLTNIPKSVFNLQELECLNISGNNISSLAKEINNLKKLKLLTFVGTYRTTSKNFREKPTSFLDNIPVYIGNPNQSLFIFFPYEWKTKLEISEGWKNLPKNCILVAVNNNSKHVKFLKHPSKGTWSEIPLSNDEMKNFLALWRLFRD